ncbi:MAG: hypothetical protein OHK0044_23980 [Burkholderiaceae bacterium]
MATTGIAFRRVVLNLAAGEAPAPALEAAAVLARWLDAELFACFVENSALYEYARLPFAREIGLGAAWRPLEPGRLLDDYVAAAAAVQRRLRAIAARTGVPCEFEILRGDPAEWVARAAAGDLLALLEPADPFARWMPPRTVPAAGHLILPRQLRRVRGPVVVVATRPDETAQAVATQIAAAAGVELIALEATRDAARVLPANARRVRCAPTARAAAAALQAAREGLIVVARSIVAGRAAAPPGSPPGPSEEAAAADWIQLAAERGVPLLVVDGV